MVATEAPPIPQRTALRYYGGKWKLARWVISHFPTHTCYVEPYAGACSVLLQKPPSWHDVYNDLDSDVVTFFRTMRDQPAELIQAIDLTPFSREEYDLAYAVDVDHEPTDVERARRLYIRSWQAMHAGPRAEWHTGWRFERSNVRSKRVVDDWRNTKHLLAVAARLRSVQIEHDDALKVIARYDAPATLFYVDPPYPAQIRSERWRRSGYRHEMNDHDHRVLASTLHQIQGYALVSGYDCPLYRELYRGWPVSRKRVAIDTHQTRTECLWASPRTAERAGTRQLDLPTTGD